jgi:hypothetical protein
VRSPVNDGSGWAEYQASGMDQASDPKPAPTGAGARRRGLERDHFGNASAHADRGQNGENRIAFPGIGSRDIDD